VPHLALDLDVADCVSLAASVTLQGEGQLVDHDLLRTIELNATAHLVIEQLARPVPLRDLIASVEQTAGWTPAEAADAVWTVVAELDEQVGLEVRRARGAWRQPLVTTLRLIDVVRFRGRRRPARRAPATAAGLGQTVLRQGMAPLAMLAAVAGVLYLAMAIAEAPNRSVGLVGWLPVIGGAHLLVLYGHELGHLSAMRAVGAGPAILAHRGLRIGLVFAGTPTSRGLALIAAAGPLAALATGMVLSLAARSLSDPPWSALRWSALLGVGHLGALGPWAADGRLLRRAWGAR
jgi:hypothetical protein